jgi:hypothetical protein
VLQHPGAVAATAVIGMHEDRDVGLRQVVAQGRSVEVVRTSPLVRRLMCLCGVTDQLEVRRPPAATAA